VYFTSHNSRAQYDLMQQIVELAELYGTTEDACMTTSRKPGCLRFGVVNLDEDPVLKTTIMPSLVLFNSRGANVAQLIIEAARLTLPHDSRWTRVTLGWTRWIRDPSSWLGGVWCLVVWCLAHVASQWFRPMCISKVRAYALTTYRFQLVAQ